MGSKDTASPFLTSELVGGEWSASRPCRSTPGERGSGTHSTGGWVGPRARLDAVEKRKKFCTAGNRPEPSSPYPVARRYIAYLFQFPFFIRIVGRGV
jgi:hypothetical protein